MIDSTNSDHRVVFALPAIQPYEQLVVFPSENADVNLLDQALTMIRRNRPDMLEILERGYPAGFTDAVRARDYSALVQIADERNRYLLSCWIMVMSSSLFPPLTGQRSRRVRDR